VINSEAEALELVMARVILPISVFVEEEAGGPITGSWWRHPRGKQIYALLTALEESDQVGLVKLLNGKLTLIHRSLWPQLVRVAMDPARRRDAKRGLILAARKLLADVEDDDEVRIAQWNRVPDPEERKRACEELEARLLVYTAGVYTEKGRHATGLRSWRTWAGRDLIRAGKAIPFDQALKALALA